MPELRPRKPSAAKAPSKEKTPSKRKAAATDDASPIAPKKLKGDLQSKVSKKAKRSTSIAERKEERKEEQPAIDEDENQASEDEDEAQALAKVIDSDAEEEEDDDGPDEEIKDLSLPEVSKDVVKASNSDDSEPGVVYIGRIPRGFYEHQMREYFTQFGQVNRIRMSRNKATGQSKHFAFIEFAELGVAEIVAKTMDNYLLAGHILKVKMVPKSQVHDKLWVGANKRFKKIPWNKMAGNRLKKPLSESTWTDKITKEETKRNERAKKLLEIGYEFEAPKLKSIHDTDDAPALDAAEDEAPKVIDAAPESDEVESKQPAPAAKKSAKGDKKSAAKTGKKAKKAKK
ncbi:RNA-binding domain-containing protein [Xylaria scruposa]|nr:RNA-binding domain-containing protein [Xylaria scruposa]